MTKLLPAQATRAYGLAVAAVGAGSALAARPVSRWSAQSVTARPDARIVVVLGLRQLVQGALVATAPDPAMSRISAAADVLHAATMLAAALVWPAYRRPALLSGGMAAASAVTGFVVAARQSADPR